MLLNNRYQFNTLLLCLLLVTISGLNEVVAKPKEVDYLGLAALMVRDGNYERAAQALESANTEQEEFDFARFYTLKGLVELKLELYPAAIASLENAIDSGQEESQVYIYLAQAAYRNEQYQKALDALTQGGPEVLESSPGIVLMKSYIHWTMGDEDAAWQALEFGESSFTDEAPFARRKVFLLVELGLYQEASRHGIAYLERYEPGADDYVVIGEALRQAGQSMVGLNFLEIGRIKHPDNERMLLALAKVYADLGKYVTAATMMEQAAALGGDYLIDAAELYRRGGHLGRALFMNEKVLDQEKKLKQRLAILLDSEMYEYAESMTESLYRHGMLEDDEIRYALAFAAFKSGNFNSSNDHLDAITKPSLFRKATALRKAMSVCDDAEWRCL